MVDKAKKTVQARARVAHKLAKYVRAYPTQLNSKISPNLPSISHLRISLLTQDMEEAKIKNGEIIKKLGIQLMTKKPILKGKETTRLKSDLGNLFSQAMLSSSLQENTKVDESSFLKTWLQETS